MFSMNRLNPVVDLCFLIIAANEMPFKMRFTAIFLSSSLFVPAYNDVMDQQEKQMIDWPSYAFFIPVFLIQFAYYLVVVIFFMYSEVSFKWSFFGNVFTVQELQRFCLLFLPNFSLPMPRPTLQSYDSVEQQTENSVVSCDVLHGVLDDL
eukprot:TRINITY_DN433_c0_g1_i22.p1 TRINITY_DN433_c0_g1~~TRINITY_DN433_c0_g1_i22.p1  ORF type:complete len:150 (-),score=27.60 TRINITY_DN433_c0_g1_i22:349-798(-)